jgi:HSP20 family protein
MTMRNLVPSDQGTTLTPFVERGPFSQLRREMDRLFGDVFRSAASPEWSGATAWPTVELNETDKEIRVTAELPGMSEKDIDLSVDNGMLTISGERKGEEHDRERGWSERYYGRFERRIALPDGADQEHCEANFRDGELVVKIPKTEEMRRGRKIAINTGTRH